MFNAHAAAAHGGMDAPAWRIGLGCLALCAGLAWPMAAQAERADRTKPMTLEASKGGVLDVKRGVVVYQGDVVIQQGTLSIRAEKVEVRELPDRRTAVALGAQGKPATFRQKREGLSEMLEGSAERIEYDDRSDTVRFLGGAAVRRLRGNAVADEVTGAVITYDNRNEVFSVDGSANASAAAAAPGAGTTLPNGRTRVVLSPRQSDGDAATPANPAASGAAPSATPAPSGTPAPASTNTPAPTR
jgi:lipopolysaccharide export system protein LptA